ncbi:acyltransferase family protein [Clostridium perfringens]
MEKVEKCCMSELEKRNFINSMKFIAICSVVNAHSIPNISGGPIFNFFIKFSTEFGSLGVGIFFLISGFLFNNNYKIKDFFSKKIKSIIIPWLASGFIIYFYVYIRKGGLSFKTYLNFIIGNGSYLYYLTVLFIIYFIFLYIKNKYIILLLFFMSIISIKLTYINFFNNINPYLNPFNWIIYFVLGILLKQYLDKVIFYCEKYLKLNIIIYLVLNYYIIYNNFSIGYWGKYSILLECLGILIVIAIVNKYLKFKEIFNDIGRESYSIYLTHMIFAGAVVKLFSLSKLKISIIFSPLLVLILSYLGIRVLRFLFDKYRLSWFIDLIIGPKR